MLIHVNKHVRKYQPLLLFRIKLVLVSFSIAWKVPKNLFIRILRMRIWWRYMDLSNIILLLISGLSWNIHIILAITFFKFFKSITTLILPSILSMFLNSSMRMKLKSQKLLRLNQKPENKYAWIISKFLKNLVQRCFYFWLKIPRISVFK